MRFLCLSDIHGHSDALYAVLATAERRGYSRVLVAGDLCFPGPDPAGVWRRLTELRALAVQGVGDRALATVDERELRPRDDFERHRLRRFREVRAELGPAAVERIGKLPQVLRQPLDGGGHLLLVHGSPRDPLEELAHDMSDEALVHWVGDDPARVVVCGGSHVPFDRTLRRTSTTGVETEVRVVCVGSVGEAPGFDDENAPRVAHAAFIDDSAHGIKVELFSVPLGRAARTAGAASR